MGPWKAVRNRLKQGDLTGQLFDMDSDPGETTNVAADNPDVVKIMTRVMEQEHESSAVFPLPGID